MVDGEGGDLRSGDDLRHEYLMLRAGEHVLIGDGPLMFEDCAWFLTHLPRTAIYVSYFFDYDVTMMLRDWPPDKIGRLLDRESRTLSDRNGRDITYPIDWNGYQVDYLPHKRFSVRRRLSGTTYGAWYNISDVGTFFQCAFVKALDTWGIGSVEERDSIRASKMARQSFTELTPETIAYNALECRLGAELMEYFRAVCIDTGYVPSVWEGPGAMATAMLHRHDIPPSKEYRAVPKQVWRSGLAAYYGGRFETTAVGKISGMVEQWDINSAYPYACTQLPCLSHGVWRNSLDSQTAKIGLAHYRFTHVKEAGPGELYNLPTRLPDGSIRFPKSGEGWYWSREIQSAIAAGTTVMQLGVGWIYEQTCQCQPFEFVNGVYRDRLRLGKSGKGLVLKLGLNSLYGKTAQSIGNAPMANPVWSGLITAITRARLIDAYSQFPGQCLMLATDGLFFTGSINSPTMRQGAALGEWDRTTHSDGMFIIQPGVYFVSSELGKPKTRGVPQRQVVEAREDFYESWARYVTDDMVGEPPTVLLPVTNFIGLRLAYARHKPETAGSWVEGTKNVSFGWGTKRDPRYISNSAVGYRTYPYETYVRTTPYGKPIGGNLVRIFERSTYDDQPDFVEGFE